MGKDFWISKNTLNMVHVGKKERAVLHSYLLNEGVIAVKEDNTKRHEQTKIDNVKILCVMTSLESRGFAKKTYCWLHRYYTITSDGCTFLRQALGITKDNVNPKTHQTKPVEQQAGRPEGGRREMTRGRGFGGRGGRGGFGDRGARGGEGRPFRGEAQQEAAPAPTPAPVAQ